MIRNYKLVIYIHGREKGFVGRFAHDDSTITISDALTHFMKIKDKLGGIYIDFGWVIIPFDMTRIDAVALIEEPLTEENKREIANEEEMTLV